MGLPEPLVESSTEGSSILRFAEEAIAAEYRAVNRPVPVVVRELGEGRAGPTIAQVAADAAATAIVVGARRPHAFGRFTHPDVVEYLQRHTAVPVHVVPLQAEPAQSILSPSSR
jgi:nucleotide-binding universal stress UspA family protein